MRLLFDEQLSEELCALLGDVFRDSLHVRQLGAGGASDEDVWRIARDRTCLLVTKDEDFHASPLYRRDRSLNRTESLQVVTAVMLRMTPRFVS